MKKIAIIPNDIKDTGLIQTKRIIDCLSGRVKLYMPSNYSVVGGNINYVTLAELYASAAIIPVFRVVRVFAALFGGSQPPVQPLRNPPRL